MYPQWYKGQMHRNFYSVDSTAMKERVRWTVTFTEPDITKSLISNVSAREGMQNEINKVLIYENDYQMVCNPREISSVQYL